MPIPNPKQGEKKEDYLPRCMGDGTVLNEIPDNQQRLAVCSNHYDDVLLFAKHDNQTVKEAEIFAVGKWNGLTFSKEDLEGMVDAFSKLTEFHKVPLKLGHNAEQKITDGQPALGWVDAIWVSGKKLMARFVDVPQIILDAMEKRLYRTVSIELDRGVKFKGMSFENVLSGVALLGADIPAVGNLADLKTLMTRQDIKSTERLCFTAINGNLKEEDIMTPEEIAALQAKVAKAEAAEAIAKAQAAKFSAQAEVAQAETAKFKADEEVRVALALKTKVEFNRKSVTELLEKAVKDEVITPAKREMFTKMLRVDDDGAMSSISVEDVTNLVGVEKTVNFTGQQGNEGTANDETGSGDAGLDISDKAYELMGKNTDLSFTRATEIVMRSNRKLAEEYKNSNDNQAA